MIKNVLLDKEKTLKCVKREYILKFVKVSIFGSSHILTKLRYSNFCLTLQWLLWFLTYESYNRVMHLFRKLRKLAILGIQNFYIGEKINAILSFRFVNFIFEYPLPKYKGSLWSIDIWAKWISFESTHKSTHKNILYLGPIHDGIKDMFKTSFFHPELPQWKDFKEMIHES